MGWGSKKVVSHSGHWVVKGSRVKFGQKTGTASGRTRNDGEEVWVNWDKGRGSWMSCSDLKHSRSHRGGEDPTAPDPARRVGLKGEGHISEAEFARIRERAHGPKKITKAEIKRRRNQPNLTKDQD